MKKYLLKRLVFILLSMFLLITITFFLMHAVPGSPFSKESKTSEAVLEKMDEKFHLNEPTVVQYLYYLKGLARLDLGPSIKYDNYSVSELIGIGFPVSARLGLIATVLMLIFSIPVGVIQAMKRGGHWDKLLLAVSTFGIGVPSFVMASILMRIFAIWLGWCPIYGVDNWKGYILPAVALSIGSVATLSRRVRSSMSEVMSMKWIYQRRR